MLVRVRPKPTPTVSALQQAATAGDLETVKVLLNGDASQNIYTIADNEEALLIDVLRAGQTEVAHHLFGLYIIDLVAVRQFLDIFQRDVESMWRNTQILVACGPALCDAVAALVTNSMRLPRHGCWSRRGLIVLLKRGGSCSAQGQEVVWLSPSSEQSSDVRAMARIIELIYTERGGGVFNMNSDLLGLTARHGMLELFIGMHKHLSETFNWEMLCRLASFHVNEITKAKDAITGLQILDRRLEAFQLDKMYAKEDAWKLLQPPMELQDMALFEYVLAGIVRSRGSTRWHVLRDLFKNSDLLSDERINESDNAINYGPFVKEWIRNEGNLWLPHNTDTDDGTSWLPLMHLCLSAKYPDIVLDDIHLFHMMQYNNDIMVDSQRIEFVQLMFEAGRLHVLRRWFEENPDIPKMLHTNGVLYDHLDTTIRDFTGHMSLVENLFEHCLPELFDDDSIMELVLTCASCPRATGMLRILLELPQCPHVASESWTANDKIWSPMYTALISCCPQNFQVMFDSLGVHNNLEEHFEYNGDTILTAAIWSHFENSDGNSQFAMAVNGVLLNQKARRRVEVEYAKWYFRIFYELYDDANCNMFTPNYRHETVAHRAVINDNVKLFKFLIKSNMRVYVTNLIGTLPMHLVRSLDVFEMLLAKTYNYKTVMAWRNNLGETPLGSVANYACNDPRAMAGRRRAKTMELLNAMWAKTEDAPRALTSSENGTTALHGSNVCLTMARWLLSHRVDINAVDTVTGETALHRMLVTAPPADVMVVMLSSSKLDWRAVTRKGVSYLAFFVSLTEQQLAGYRAIVESRHADIERLFAEHCNSKDAQDVPLLHTAMRSDTNEYCLRRLLDHKERLCLDGVVRAAIRDVGALRVALELCSERPTELAANPSAETLSHAIGEPATESLWLCAESVRMLLKAGVNVTEPHALGGLNPVANVLRHLEEDDDSRKAVVTTAAALIAAGADYTGDTDAMRETVLQCLLGV